MGMPEGALSLLAQAARKSPRDAEAAYYHGMVLVQSGRVPEGIGELTRASRLRPGDATTLVALGNALMMVDQADASAQRHREAIKLNPKGPSAGPALVGLSLALARSLRFEEAAEIAREATALMPDAMQAWGNLFSALRDAGRMEEGLAVLREATKRLPKDVSLLSHLLAGLNYSSATDASEARGLAERFGSLLGPEDRVSFTNSKDPNRPLRVAFLSSDLRTHSVAFFVEPILRAIDRASILPIVYATSPKKPGATEEDATTARLRLLTHEWHEVRDLSTDDLVRRIRADAIDVLVELNGHTHGHRLPVLARRAAPVQVTYLGYPGTTGVTAIDARFVDAITDPAGAEATATESLVRIAGCFLCYSPLIDAGEVAPLPTIASGHITFGSFNSMPKITPQVLDLWARVMQSVPGSRLIIKNRALADPRVAQRLMADLAARGITAERVITQGQRPSQAEHLREYARIDLALDTFPYNGTTTTCEALWMGVPVVTIRGTTHAGRVGASLLSAVGLQSLIAGSSDEYVRRAAELATDSARLASLRAGLRDRLTRSRLMDASALVREYSQAVRGLWQTWCETGHARAERTP